MEVEYCGEKESETRDNKESAQLKWMSTYEAMKAGVAKGSNVDL